MRRPTPVGRFRYAGDSIPAVANAGPEGWPAAGTSLIFRVRCAVNASQGRPTLNFATFFPSFPFLLSSPYLSLRVSFLVPFLFFLSFHARLCCSHSPRVYRNSRLNLWPAQSDALDEMSIIKARNYLILCKRTTVQEIIAISLGILGSLLWAASVPVSRDCRFLFVPRVPHYQGLGPCNPQHCVSQKHSIPHARHLQTRVDLPLYANVRLGLGSGALSAPAQEHQGVDETKKSEEGPDEEAKGNGRFGRVAVRVSAASRGAKACSEGDGAGEPEEHSYPLDGQGCDAVEKAGEVKGCYEEIGKHQQGPD